MNVLTGPRTFGKHRPGAFVARRHSRSAPPSACCQRAVSTKVHIRAVPIDQTALLHRLVGGDPRAAEELLALAPTTTSASVLVVAALLSQDGALLTRATQLAHTSRERQLVVLADAHLRGNTDLLDALVRDHLVEHPDHLLAAWIAGRPQHPMTRH